MCVCYAVVFFIRDVCYSLLFPSDSDSDSLTLSFGVDISIGFLV